MNAEEIIRNQWGFIISEPEEEQRKQHSFLVAVPYTDTILTRWSISPWDAYWTRNRRVAKKIAARVDGVVMEFNRITGDMKKIR